MSCPWRILHVDLAWDEVALDTSVIAQWPRFLAEQHQVLPFRLDRTSDDMCLRIVAVQPHNPWIRDHLLHQFAPVRKVEVIPVSASWMSQLLARAYQDRTEHDAPQGPGPSPWLLSTRPEENEIVSFVDSLLRHAITHKITDIHFEPSEDCVSIRMREDGLLHPFSQIDGRSWTQVCGRLKVLGHMDLGEMRLPQSGRFTLHEQFQKVDCRVATHPSLFGEKVTLRVLPQDRQIQNLEKLGFTEEQRHKLHHMMRYPEGMMVICGPTGSGKTTTLYSLLQHVDCVSKNVMTLEDPVEYHMKGVMQTDLSTRGSIQFPEGVRSLLRQDPDVILVGEMRDEETARMCLRAAATGHQVLSTLHVRSLPGVWIRLEDLGISQSSLYDNTIGLVHQRLVRVLCPHCAPSEKAYPPAEGCENCQGTGYKGRTVIAEIALKEDIKRLERTSTPEGLWHHALMKIRQGITTLEECERVLGPLPGDQKAACV